MTMMATSGGTTAPRADFAWLRTYPKETDWFTRIEPAPLYKLLDDAARAHGRRPCTTFLGKTLSYAEIARQVDRAAAGLQRMGVAKGNRVGLFLPNCPTFIIYYFAVLKCGGTVVNFNPLYTLEELS